MLTERVASITVTDGFGPCTKLLHVDLQEIVGQSKMGCVLDLNESRAMMEDVWIKDVVDREPSCAHDLRSESPSTRSFRL